MNIFNKTEAAILPMQTMLPNDFPFSQINSLYSHIDLPLSVCPPQYVVSLFTPVVKVIEPYNIYFLACKVAHLNILMPQIK